MSGTIPEDPADTPADTLDIEAAEYVLGLLPPGPARDLADRAHTDPALAARIASWERHLAPLATLIDPIDPPRTLWQRLALATGTTRPTPDRTRPWRNTAIAATAVAAGLATLLLARPPVPPGAEIAVLTEFAGPDPVFLVRLGTDGQGTIVTTGKPNIPQGRALELWALRPGATVPESMGMLPSEGRTRLPLVVPLGTQLLVTQEQPGGSPTKQPTGPVVLRGSVIGL